ncbi:uncharacterized protein LOC132740434 [Ruditapes philippinarum]|uniref:uncharacterized protein LOC132740434 n=1 Tax=Ruditapes philippinarum TaxID=129788 RepID=UPI00295AAA29|nr:uncharacterized protein LOC132740434 [Ruditapes philippinarum]
MDDQYKSGTNSHLYDIFNDLGYSKVRSEQRVKIYENASRCFARVTNRNWSVADVDVTVLGSRGEGMAVALGSDIDIMHLQPAVRCFETFPTENKESIDKYVATFKLNFTNVPEGYAKLHLETIKDIPWPDNHNRLVFKIKRALTSDGYLKNDQRIIDSIENDGERVKVEGWLSAHFQHERANGPAQPLQYPLPFRGLYIPIDFIPAFLCEYPTIFDEWFERVQGKAWPGVDTSMKVKKSNTFVVPVGLAGSDEEVLQWRMSFTLAERLLVMSFNDAQIKTYAAMKMIVKHALNPICENMSSYQVKTAMFWVSEKNQGILNIDDFNEMLLDVIIFLTECVRTRCLQHYFTPSKNLMFRKFSDEERSCLLASLNAISRDIAYALRRCPLIHIMCSLPKKEIKKRLIFRNICDELLAAYLSIEPEEYDVIEHLLHRAQSSQEYLELYVKHVLPIVRQNNPYGYFHLLSSMNVDEITSIMMNGIKQGYNKIWLN